jgi:hypothetical protein
VEIRLWEVMIKIHMKKLLLTLVLAIVSSSVMAEWVYIAESEEEVEEAYFVTAYADPDTIRKTGNRVKMWVMEDFKIAKTLDILSARHKDELDCNKKQYRNLFYSFHSGHMGRGETLIIHNKRGDWNTPNPNWISADILKFACSFRPELPETFPDETFA